MRLLPALLVAALAAAGCGPSGPGLSSLRPGYSQGAGSDTGRYLVKFRAGVSEEAQALALRKAGATPVRTIASLGVSIVRMKAADALLGASVDYIEPDRVRSLPEAEAQLARRAGAAGRSQTYARASRRAQSADDGRPINDPLASDQWGLDAVHAYQAWNRTMGDPDVVVAVVDTGVDLGHPDLRDRLVPGASFVNEVQGPSGADDDTTVVPFKNVGPVDDNGHGTHVSGIIAASADNGIGVAGVAPHCRLMPVKVLAYNTRGFDGDVASGVTYAVDHGARIINMSLGGEGGSQTLERAVAYAAAHGVLVCSAMGNDGDDFRHAFGANINYPAAYDGVLAVAAMDSQGAVASFSNHGRWVGVAGPGVRVLSTTPTYQVFDPLISDYDHLDGTSMATPFVSGVAALAASAHPGLRGQDLRRAVIGGASDVLFPGLDMATGAGMVDAARALK